jgi:predicted oxidoreductase
MKTYTIPNTDLKITRIAYGCMPLGGSWDSGQPISTDTRKKALAAIQAALDGGINFFDHADIYCSGKSEEVFSGLWQVSPSIRSSIYIQSKCGIRSNQFDFSYNHIMESVEVSLKRLKTSYLDVLLLHRPDALVEPEEVARAFDELQASGKVRYFGVSNHTAAQLELLRKFVRQPILFNQVELNVIHTHMLDEGINFNQDQPTRPLRNEGTIEYCRLNDITLQAWGPLARGKLTGRNEVTLSDSEQKTSAILTEMAKVKGVSPEAILVAWILRHPAHIQPIIGTSNPGRIQASCQADAVEMTREDWYRLFIAGRGASLP